MRLLGRLALVALFLGLNAGCRLVPTALRPAETNRIAYVGGDGNVYAIRPDGTDRTLITGGEERTFASISPSAASRRYHWPAWSPDGGSLALLAGEADQSADAVVVAAARGGRLTRVFASARQEPFLAVWSRSGAQLAFLARSAGQVALSVARADGRGGPVPVAEGETLYFSWMPDSRHLFVHLNGDSAESPAAVLALFDTRGQSPPTYFSARPAIFRAPAIRSDGNRLALSARTTPETAALVELNVQGEEQRRLANVSGGVAALWSPSGDALVFGVARRPEEPLFSGLQLQLGDAARPVRLTSDPLIAFFWSPDGRRIAYVRFDNDSREFSWWVVEVAGGPPQRLGAFTPTRDELFVLTYFDQFATVMTPWSPDGRKLVYVEAARTGDTTGRIMIRAIADGSVQPFGIASLATWSWR